MAKATKTARRQPKQSHISLLRHLASSLGWLSDLRVSLLAVETVTAAVLLLFSVTFFGITKELVSWGVRKAERYGAFYGSTDSLSNSGKRNAGLPVTQPSSFTSGDTRRCRGQRPFPGDGQAALPSGLAPVRTSPVPP